mmetsp:Transcript_41129/g.88376  ORF Transcript_41129/g.88376 Transcript_41129/m.88376 type:complete len:213 (-) Transcript_41129:422-1060(-)
MVWIPLRCPSSALLCIEVPAEGALRSPLRTTLVIILVRGIIVAEVGMRLLGAFLPDAAEVLALHYHFLSADVRGMQGGRGAGVVMHRFDDVVLAPSWPWVLGILSKQPESWPNPAACRGVFNFSDEQPSIVGVPGVYPYRLSTLSCFKGSSVVAADVNVAIGSLDEASCLCIFLVKVVHNTLCGINIRPKRELGKEALCGVGLLQTVPRSGR